MAKRSRQAVRTDAQQELRERSPLVGLLRRVLPLLLIVVGLAGLWFGLMPDELPVKRVKVESQLKRIDAAELRAVIEPQVGEGLLQLDVDGLRTALEELPWVQRASVRRAWPDALLVRVEEQQPLARWADGGLVNRHGERFAAPAAPWQSELPLFAGPKGSSLQLGELYREMSRMLAPLGLGIRELVLDERRSMSLRLDNGWRLLLGRERAYPRLLRFVRVYPRNLAPRRAEIAQIDLRYTNGFAVSWRDASGAA